MTRTLQADQETARTHGSWKTRIFCKITWPDPVGIKYYSEDNFSPDAAVTPEAIITSRPEFVRQIPSGIEPDIIVGMAGFAMRVDDAATHPINDIVDQLVLPNNTRVDFFYAFDPMDGTPITEAMWSTLGIYRIDQYQTTIGFVSFSLIDFSEVGGQKLVGRRITVEQFPKAPESSYGLVMPWAFGALENYPCIPITTGATAVFDGDITETQTTIPITTNTGLPSSGTIKAGSEQILYTSKTDIGLGSSSNPVTRGHSGTTAIEHQDGETMRELLAEYEFLVADNKCNNLPDTSNPDITAAGKTVLGGTGGADGVAVDVRSIDGRNVTILQVGSAALPTITSVSPVLERTDIDGEFGGWTAGTSTTDSYTRIDGTFQLATNSAAGAIDGTEDRHVTFALFDSKAATPKTSLSVDFSTDLSGRSSQLKNLALVVSYRVVPNENLDTAATDYPFDKWQVELVRDGSQVLLVDIAKPDFSEIKGLLEKTNFIPRIGDTTGRFVDKRGAVERQRGIVFASNPFFPSFGFGFNNSANFWRTASTGDSFFSQTSLTAGFIGDFGALLTNFVSPTLRLRPDIPDGTNVLGFELIVNVRAPNATLINSQKFTHTAPADIRITVYDTDGIQLVTRRDTISGSVNTTLENIASSDITLNWTAPAETDGATIGEIKINTFADGTGDAVSALELLDAWIESLSFRTWEKTELSGAIERITGADTSIPDALLASSTRTFDQKMDLTTIVRDESVFADPWDFFSQALAVNITSDPAVASTLLMVTDIRFEVKEKPITERQATDEELKVTLDVDGVDDSALLETPDQIINFLLTDSRWWDLDSGFVDSATLASALASHGADEWKLARRINRQTSPKEAVISVLRDSGLRMVWEAGKFMFSPIGRLGLLVPTRALTTNEMPVDAAQTTRAPLHLQLVANEIDYGYDRSLTGDNQPTRNFPLLVNQGSITELGGSYALRYISDWHRQDGFAAEHSALLLDEGAWPKRPITVTGTPEWLDILLGDAATVLDSVVNINSEPTRAIRASITQSDYFQFTCEALAFRTRFFEASGDATTYIDVFHGSQLVFVIEGVTVAYLTQDGFWHLLAGLDTTSLAGLPTQTDVIEKVGTELRFAADKTSGGPPALDPRKVVLVLTKTGFLRVQAFDDNPALPTASATIVDYIEETPSTVGTALAGVRFSANKASVLGSAALAFAVFRGYGRDNNL